MKTCRAADTAGGNVQSKFHYHSDFLLVAPPPGRRSANTSQSPTLAEQGRKEGGHANARALQLLVHDRKRALRHWSGFECGICAAMTNCAWKQSMSGCSGRMRICSPLHVAPRAYDSSKKKQPHVAQSVCARVHLVIGLAEREAVLNVRAVDVRVGKGAREAGGLGRPLAGALQRVGVLHVGV
jgi:hypothetical protein